MRITSLALAVLARLGSCCGRRATLSAPEVAREACTCCGAAALFAPRCDFRSEAAKLSLPSFARCANMESVAAVAAVSGVIVLDGSWGAYGVAATVGAGALDVVVVVVAGARVVALLWLSGVRARPRDRRKGLKVSLNVCAVLTSELRC